MKEIELSPAQREHDLATIRRVSPSLYAEVLDDGLHGRADDADLALAACRCAAWERRVRGESK